MGCFEGKKTELQLRMPEYLVELQTMLAEQLGQKAQSQTATPLPKGFPVAAGVNENSMLAMNILHGMMGGKGGYKSAPPVTFGYSTPGMGFGGGMPNIQEFDPNNPPTFPPPIKKYPGYPGWGGFGGYDVG